MTLSRRMAGLMVWLVVLATVAGGATASARAANQMPTFPDLSGVWCAGPSKCLAVGSAEASDTQTVPISMRWNGQDWSFVKTPARGQSLNALACTSWTHCMAVGYPGVAQEWNGTSWRTLRTPYPIGLESVACPAVRTCIAVGSTTSAKGTTAIVWNGQTWRATPVPRLAGARLPSLASVACPSVSYCIAVDSGDGRIAFTWNGARWRRAPAPPTKAFAIACPRQRLCVATGSDLSMEWNRRSWRLINMPLFNTPESISCPSRSFCMAGDPQFTMVWQGRSWSRIRPALNNTHALWCGSPTDCVAVGGDSFHSRAGNASQWNGHSWRMLRVTKVDRLDMISCASTTDCVAVGTANTLGAPDPLAERWNGTAWTVIAAPSVTSDDGFPPALSCPTASFCMAVGDSAAGDPQAQWWDGSTWHATSVPAPPGGAFLSSVSCTSKNNCVIVSGLDVAIVWNGSTWKMTSAGISGQAVVLTSVSCSGAICMASGWATSSPCSSDCQTSFLAEEWNGSAWTVSDDLASGINPFPYSSISCSTSTFCMEAGFASGAMSWNGTSWQSVPGSLLDVDSVSCASDAMCLTVGALPTGFPAPHLQTTTQAWNGTSWSAAKSVPAGDGLGSVSCPSATRCVAVGSDNYVLAVAQAWNGTSWTPQAPVNP